MLREKFQGCHALKFAMDSAMPRSAKAPARSNIVLLISMAKKKHGPDKVVRLNRLPEALAAKSMDDFLRLITDNL